MLFTGVPIGTEVDRHVLAVTTRNGRNVMVHEVRAEMGGTLRAVRAEPNAVVREGDMLATVD